MKTPNSDTGPTFDETTQVLEQFLATQAQDGISELVLVSLLREYADETEARGYISRSWRTDQ